MMHVLIENFMEWAKKNSWTIERVDATPELPEEVTARYKKLPEEWLEFINHFSDIINGTETMWFLTCKNYIDDVLSYDDFEKMSIEAAEDDDEWSAEIKEFGDNTFPGGNLNLRILPL